jgi:hypothetical protein
VDTLNDWLSTFWKILTEPSQATFLAAAKCAKRKFVTAMLWLIAIATLYYIRGRFITGVSLGIMLLFLAVIALPISVLVCVTSIHFFLKRMFHCKADHYDEILYLTVAVIVVVSLIVLGFSLIPGITGRILMWAALVYLVVLLVVAVKSITKLMWVEALVSVIVSLIVAGGAFVCSPFLIASLTGGVEGIF